jgi:hypothetical protein
VEHLGQGALRGDRVLGRIAERNEAHEAVSLGYAEQTPHRFRVRHLVAGDPTARDTIRPGRQQDRHGGGAAVDQELRVATEDGDACRGVRDVLSERRQGGGRSSEACCVTTTTPTAGRSGRSATGARNRGSLR